MNHPIIIFITVTITLLVVSLIAGDLLIRLSTIQDAKLVAYYEALPEIAKNTSNFECIFDANVMSKENLPAYHISKQQLTEETTVVTGVILGCSNNQHLGPLFRMANKNTNFEFNAWGERKKIVRRKLAKVTYIKGSSPIKIELSHSLI